jgi:phosphatidylinositol alpha-mannosyltransferase
VVSSDLEAFRRVLDNGRCGRHFTNGDSADLARALVELLDDPQGRARTVELARERAWLYDWGRVTREIVDVYRSVRSPGEKVREDMRGQFVGRLARGTRLAHGERG